MMGVDIVENRETNKPDTDLAIEAFEMMKDMGLVLGKVYCSIYTNLCTLLTMNPKGWIARQRSSSNASNVR